MDLYEKNGNILYILNVLKKYSDEEHKLSISEIKDKIKEIYDVEIDPRTIRRNINLLKEKFDYDISTYNDNKIGYYISNDPDTDFEPGEIRAIIDTFSYSSFIEEKVAKEIIKKCRNLQTVYENEKIKNYKVYSSKGKTNNKEVIKNIEDISESIRNKHKVKFDYWKYCIQGNKIEKEIVSTPIVSPYAIIYDKQQFYMLGIKEGNTSFYNFRLDRIKNLVELKENIKINKTEKEIEEYTDYSVEVFGGENIEIEAICNQCLIEEAFERFGKKAKTTPIDKNNFKITVSANPFGFQLWAMRNLDMVTVTKPASLIDEIRKVIEDASNRYK